MCLTDAMLAIAAFTQHRKSLHAVRLKFGDDCAYVIALTLRLPEALQTRLKQSAQSSHRSINKQAVVLLEQALGAQTTAAVVPQDVIERRMAALMAIGKSFSGLHVVDPRSDDEIMGCNDYGLPT